MTLRNQNNQNLISQILKFESDIRSTGRKPEQILDELIASGKYSASQIEQAKSKAQQAMNFFRK